MLQKTFGVVAGAQEYADNILEKHIQLCNRKW